MSERMTDERLRHCEVQLGRGDRPALADELVDEACRARASEDALLLERDEARGRAAGLLLEQTANATLRAQVKEMRRALEQARVAIEHAASRPHEHNPPPTWSPGSMCEVFARALLTIGTVTPKEPQP